MGKRQALPMEHHPVRWIQVAPPASASWRPTTATCEPWGHGAGRLTYIDPLVMTNIGKPWENRRKMVVSWDYYGIYLLVMTNIAIENGNLYIVSFP